MEDLQDCLNCFGESAISDDVISVAQCTFEGDFIFCAHVFLHGWILSHLAFNSDCAGTATVTADGSLQTFSGPDSSGNSVDDDGSRTTTGGTAGITSLITSTSSAKSARTTRGSVGSATGGTTSPAGNGTGTSNSLTSAEGGSSTRKKVNVVLLTPLSLVLLLWI